MPANLRFYSDRLLVLAGEKCERIMARKIVNVKVRDVELDEVWSLGQEASRASTDAG